MKKYCLTDCGRNKLQKIKNHAEEWFAILLAIIIVVIGIAGVLYILGNIIEILILNDLFPEPDKPFKSVFDAGVVGFVMLLLITVSTIIIWYTTLITYRAIKYLLKLTIFKTQSEGCKLFEECKED
jgi:hypothetical protein